MKRSKQAASESKDCILCDALHRSRRSYLGLRDRTEMEGKVEDVLQLFLLTISTEAWKHAMAEANVFTREAEIGLRFCLGIKVREISYIHSIIIIGNLKLYPVL